MAPAQTTEPAPADGRASSAAASPTALAPFAADEVFATVLDRMWRTSATFRRQCRRITLGAPGVRLRLRLTGATSSTVRARSLVEWRDGSIDAVAMFVPVGDATEELIAHEMEHVLEQVDRVDLAAHVASGVAWRHSPTGFETRRAIEAGRRVAAEVAAFRGRAGPP